jgi:hypothetical protein
VFVFVCLLQRHAYDFGKSGAGHSIAWAFLRLSGLQHKQLMQGQPLKLKLQLYHYSAGAIAGTLWVCSLGLAAGGFN